MHIQGIKLLITVATFISFAAFGQKSFTGTYFTSKKDIGFESDIFQFEEDGTFKYIFFTCTGTGLGKGEYEITEGDSLRLQFEDCKECMDKKAIEMFTGDDDSVKINLQIKSWDDETALVGASVYFQKASIGTGSDESGIAKFSAKKFNGTQKLLIQFIGYETVEIEVPVTCSKISGVIRLTSNWIYGHTDTRAYKILSWKKSKLRLQRYPNLAITYDKVSAKRTDKLIEGRLGEKGFKLYRDKICAPGKK